MLSIGVEMFTGDGLDKEIETTRMEVDFQGNHGASDKEPE